MLGSEETSRKRTSTDDGADNMGIYVVEVAQKNFTEQVSADVDDKLEKEYGKEWKDPENANSIHMIPCVFTTKGTKKSPTGAKAERAVYDALQKLNDNIIKWFTTQNMFGFVFHDQIYDGEEIDFVFLTIHGFMFVECKANQKKNKAQDAYEDARVQLERKVLKLLDSLGFSSLAIPVLKVVTFPLLARCDIKEENETRVLFKEDLSGLKNWLRRTKFLQPENSIAFENYKTLATIFLSKYHTNGKKFKICKEFKIRGISNCNDILERNFKNTFYTKEQAALLESAHIQNVCVTGAAGTGKTFVLKKRVQLLDEDIKDDGKKILVITYNVPIKLDVELWVKKNTKSEGRSVRVQTFHALLWHILYAVPVDKRPSKDTEDADIVNYILSNGVLDKYFKSNYTKTPQKYLHILVDEAQDLSGDWVTLLDGMLNKNVKSDLWIFKDPFQKVRRDTSNIYELPETFARHVLTKVVRNTHNIFESYQHCHKSLREEAVASGELLKELSQPQIHHDVYGLHPEYVTAENDLQLNEALVSKIKEMQSKGVPLNDIAILTYGSNMNSNAADIHSHLKNADIKWNDAEEGTKLKNASKKQADPPVILDSYQRFKGLEAKVIIFCIPKEWEPRDQDMYVGFSRAFCHLVVIGPETQINKLKRKEQKD